MVRSQGRGYRGDFIVEFCAHPHIFCLHVCVTTRGHLKELEQGPYCFILSLGSEIYYGERSVARR